MLLFSGHRVDAPGRAEPRFPPAMVPRAAAAIEAAVQQAVLAVAPDATAEPGAAPQILALTQGAAGGDLLFAESAQRHGLQLRLLQPQPEPEFLIASVLPSADGGAWAARYRAVVQQLAAPPQMLPSELPVTAADATTDSDSDTDSIYARCNLWLLNTALRHTAGQWPLRLICLWNGAPDEGPGGTGQMVRAVQSRGGQVHWIDSRGF